jgi:hypothetical protein
VAYTLFEAGSTQEVLKYHLLMCKPDAIRRPIDSLITCKYHLVSFPIDHDLTFDFGLGLEESQVAGQNLLSINKI